MIRIRYGFSKGKSSRKILLRYIETITDITKLLYVCERDMSYICVYPLICYTLFDESDNNSHDVLKHSK